MKDDINAAVRELCPRAALQNEASIQEGVNNTGMGPIAKQLTLAEAERLAARVGHCVQTAVTVDQDEVKRLKDKEDALLAMAVARAGSKPNGANLASHFTVGLRVQFSTQPVKPPAPGQRSKNPKDIYDACGVIISRSVPPNCPLALASKTTVVVLFDVLDENGIVHECLPKNRICTTRTDTERLAVRERSSQQKTTAAARSAAATSSDPLDGIVRLGERMRRVAAEVGGGAPANPPAGGLLQPRSIFGDPAAADGGDSAAPPKAGSFAGKFGGGKKGKKGEGKKGDRRLSRASGDAAPPAAGGSSAAAGSSPAPVAPPAVAASSGNASVVAAGEAADSINSTAAGAVVPAPRPPLANESAAPRQNASLVPPAGGDGAVSRESSAASVLSSAEQAASVASSSNVPGGPPDGDGGVPGAAAVPAAGAGTTSSNNAAILESELPPPPLSPSLAGSERRRERVGSGGSSILDEMMDEEDWDESQYEDEVGAEGGYFGMDDEDLDSEEEEEREREQAEAQHAGRDRLLDQIRLMEEIFARDLRGGGGGSDHLLLPGSGGAAAIGAQPRAGAAGRPPRPPSELFSLLGGRDSFLRRLPVGFEEEGAASLLDALAGSSVFASGLSRGVSARGGGDHEFRKPGELALTRPIPGFTRTSESSDQGRSTLEHAVAERVTQADLQQALEEFEDDSSEDEMLLRADTYSQENTAGNNQIVDSELLDVLDSEVREVRAVFRWHNAGVTSERAAASTSKAAAPVLSSEQPVSYQTSSSEEHEEPMHKFPLRWNLFKVFQRLSDANFFSKTQFGKKSNRLVQADGDQMEIEDLEVVGSMGVGGAGGAAVASSSAGGGPRAARASPAAASNKTGLDRQSGLLLDDVYENPLAIIDYSADKDRLGFPSRVPGLRSVQLEDWALSYYVEIQTPCLQEIPKMHEYDRQMSGAQKTALVQSILSDLKSNRADAKNHPAKKRKLLSDGRKLRETSLQNTAATSVSRELYASGREQAGLLGTGTGFRPVSDRFQTGFRPVSNRFQTSAPPPCTVHVTVPLLPHAQSKCHTCRMSDLRSQHVGSAENQKCHVGSAECHFGCTGVLTEIHASSLKVVRCWYGSAGVQYQF